MTEAAIIENGYLSGANRAHQANARDASYALAEANATIRGLNHRVRVAEAEVARLTDALALEKAHTEGLTAQTKAFASECAKCSLMADSGKRFKDGDVKKKIRLIYEAAFDVCAVKLGISNPTSRRVD